MKRGAATLALVAATLLAGLTLKAQDDAMVDFSFDQVDLHTVVTIVSQRTGKRFILDKGVEGKVTIVTPRIRSDQVYPLFLSILESINCTVTPSQDGTSYRIVAVPGGGLPDTPVLGPNDATPHTGLVTKVLRLNHVRAVDVQKALQPRMGADAKGRLVALDETDHLIITDTAQAVAALERIVREIDKPGLSQSTEVVRLAHADAKEIARELSDAIAGAGDSMSRAERLRQRMPQVTGQADGEGGARRPVVVATPHSNSLLLVGTPAQLDELKRLIALMDIDTRSGMSAIFLQYLDAEETAKTLNALLSKAPEKGQAAEASSPKKIAIEASVSQAALIVDASPREFQTIQDLVATLDQPPQKVHVEVVIAEISLGDDFKLGFTVQGINAPGKVGDTVVQGSLRVGQSAENLLSQVQSGVFPAGISVGLAHGARLDGAGNLVVGIPAAVNIDALRTKSNVKILSNTSLEAQNNREAAVSVVNNIPLLKSTVQGTGTGRDVIQNIERVDVGIKLKMTPHVNPNREIQLQLTPSIEAIIDQGPANTQFAPTIAKREVSTTITIQDNTTAVISGLIRDDQTKIEERVPILGSIPLLGRLFRHTVETKRRTNLMILVTPHIVTDPAVAARMEKALREKTGLRTSDVELEPAGTTAAPATTKP